MTNIRLDKHLTTFEGVFCSGFFIPDQAIVTALALLFDKVHFLNQLEYVIELSKRYLIEVSNADDIPQVSLQPIEPGTWKPLEDTDEPDPLSILTEGQRRTVNTYLYLSRQFFIRNARLFPEVFDCSLLPKGEVLSVELIKKGKPGKLNLYKVKENPFAVSTGAEDELSRLLSQGRVPIVGGIVPTSTRPGKRPAATHVAAALAIRSVAMVLPATTEAEAEEILEARARLKDHLPPFWSSMLKLSAELTARLDQNADEETLQQEVDDAVSTTVRPALVELVSKIDKERKSWFHRILSPVAKGLRVLAGKPPTDLATLVSSSLVTASSVSLDVVQQLRKVDALKQDSGLTYCLELHKLMSKRKKKS